MTEPYKSIQHAFRKLQNHRDAHDLEIRNSIVSGVSEAIVNIYLFKGVHHFVQCLDPNEIDIDDLDEAAAKLEFACMNYCNQEEMYAFDYELYTPEDDDYKHCN